MSGNELEESYYAVNVRLKRYMPQAPVTIKLGNFRCLVGNFSIELKNNKRENITIIERIL